MIKSHKIRLYPNKEQKLLLMRYCGAYRFVYNYMLELTEKEYNDHKQHLSTFDLINKLVQLKRSDEYQWLNDISAFTLQQACMDLNKAYKLYFNKKCNVPQFKSKKKKNMFCTRASRLKFYDEKLLKIEKIGTIKYKSDFDFKLFRDGNIKNARIAYDNNKWMLTFSIESENQAYELNEYRMGIDLGIKDLAIVAYDDKNIIFHNINKSQKMKKLNKRLLYIQRKLSRKYEANKIKGKYFKSKKILKEEDKLKKTCLKMHNIRNNYIHQVTHNIVAQYPKSITIEDLNVKGMMKNRHLSKAVQQQCFGEFRRQIEYKCEKFGIELRVADRFYPSSKTCSNCGCIKSDLRLSDRTYHCNECGFIIDRDLNAAINLSKYMI